MNLKHIMLAIILAGIVVQPASAKNKKQTRNQDPIINKELLMKALKITRALLDIGGGLWLMQGILSECDFDEISEDLVGQYIGVSLLIHGIYGLHKEMPYEDIKAAAQYVYNYLKGSLNPTQTSS